jgi:hypothetical protein
MIMDYQQFQSCQVGDEGVSIIVALTDPSGDPISVQAATSKKIRLGKPDGTSVEFDAEFVTDGSDGQISYTTMTDDVDQAGEWQVQGIVVLGGATKSSAVSTFQAHDNIPEPVPPGP